MPYLNWNWKDEILKELKEKLHQILTSLWCRPEGNSTKSQLPERELKEIQSFCGMIVGMIHAIPELKLERWNSQRIERETPSNPHILTVQPEENSTKSQLPERELKEIQSFYCMIVGLTHAIPELKLERWNSQRIERETPSNPHILMVQTRRKFDKKSTSRKRTEGDPKFLWYDCRHDPCHTWTEIGKMKFSKNWKRNSIKSSHPYSADQKEIQQKVNFQKENWRRSKVSVVWL